MQAFLQRLHNFDRYRLSLAPLLGLLAGFLANRAHGGSTGWALLGEMVLGALMLTFGATVLTNLSLLVRERDLEAELALKERRREMRARRETLVEAEARRYQAGRYVHEQLVTANRRAERLEAELRKQRQQARALHEAISNVEDRAGGGELNRLHERLRRLESESEFAREARERIQSLEEAQEELRHDKVAVSQSEAEELKASLLQLAITESQRARNIDAPDNHQSGRIIELEQRIQRLAREIETLSNRRPVAVGEKGEASLVEPGGTRDKARIGFLQAMLDANKTLRKGVDKAA